MNIPAREVENIVGLRISKGEFSSTFMAKSLDLDTNLMDFALTMRRLKVSHRERNRLAIYDSMMKSKAIQRVLEERLGIYREEFVTILKIMYSDLS